MLASQIVPTAAIPRRAAETFTSGQNVLRYLRTHRICYPSEYRQLTVEGTFTPLDLQPCRLLQCLTNSVKHSGAKIVRVEIRQSNRVLEVAVKDDGAGFFLSDVAHGGGLGLIGMEERVRELGGTLQSGVASLLSERQLSFVSLC